MFALLRSLALVCLTISAAIARPSDQPIQPESLPQGFILIVQDKSGLSGNDSPLYFASNWGGWAPGDVNYKLTSRSDMRWQIILKPPTKDAPPLEFKITRGSWEQCEVAADLTDIGNRTLAKIDASKLGPNEQPKVEIVVQKFSDQRPESQAKKATDPYHSIKATGTIRRLSVVGGGVPGLMRDCLVWLPPGYDDAANATRRYPVLYMQDGQNIFEQAPGTPGEWGVDETVSELVAGGKAKAAIIVGIPSTGPDRVSEYLPVTAVGKVKPGGEAYVRFLLDEVIPRVERTFRTAAGPENRGIGGSSLGGLISLYAASKHPEVFGKVLAESPSLILGEKQTWKDLFPPSAAMPTAIYLGMGGKEAGTVTRVNEALLEAVRALDASLTAHTPMPRHDLFIDMEAKHDELAWAKRFGGAYKFLFPVSEPR